MTPKAFERRLEEIGFTKLDDEINSPAWERRTDSGSETIHLRNSMGGAYVLHLGHDCMPRASDGITGERSFEYVEREEKRETLDQAWTWLAEIGLAFLDAPHRRPLHEWQTEEGILVRENGVGIEIPRVGRLP